MLQKMLQQREPVNYIKAIFDGVTKQISFSKEFLKSILE